MGTGVFATRSVNDALKLPNGLPAPLGLIDGNPKQVLHQAIGAALGLIGTLIALKPTELMTPLRVDEREETSADLALHGEEGYNFDS